MKVTFDRNVIINGRRRERVQAEVLDSEAEMWGFDFMLKRGVAKKLALKILSAIGLGVSPRIKELSDRLSSTGKPWESMSASEFSELTEFINELQ